MTRKEFKKSVWERVKSIIERENLNLADVKIDRIHQTVSTGQFGFFSQGEDAQEIIDGIPADINEKVWLVFYLNSCGITV